MKMILTLVKGFFAGASGFSKGRRLELKRQKQGWLLPVAAIGITIAVISYVSIIMTVYRSIDQAGEMLGRTDLVLLISLGVSWMFVGLFSLLYTLSVLFKANDIPFLLTLPIPARQLMISRLIVIYGYMLPIHLLCTLPALIIYGGAHGVTLYFVLFSLLFLVTGPCIPLIFAALFNSLLVRTTGRFRHKMLMEVVSMVLLLTLLIGFQSLVSRMSIDQSASMEKILAYLQGRVDRIYRWLPLAAMVVKGAQAVFWLQSAAGFILTGLITAGGIELVSRRYDAILSNSASTASFSRLRREGSARRGDDSLPGVRPKGLYRTLLRKEFDIITSNSTFLMETTMQVLILPFLLLVMYVGGSIGEIARYLAVLESFDHIELVVFGLLMLFESLTSVTSTSISREGRSFTLTRSLPIAPEKHAVIKVLFQFILFFPAYLLYLVFVYAILPLNWLDLLYMIPGGIICVLPGVMMGLLIDLRRPLLDWSHPHQAMKQNMNVVIAMGINVVYLALMGAIGFLCTIVGLDSLGTGIILLGVAAGVSFLLWPKVKDHAVLRFGPA